MNGNVEILPVRTTSDIRSFIRIQPEIYAGEQCWIPPLYVQERKELDRRRNPFYEHASAEFYLALRDGRAVGRIAAIENRLHNVYYGDRVGFFGYYEAVDDADVSGALFAAAGSWLREKGLHFLRGPVNPSMNGNIGFLVDGFDRPSSMLMPYTKRYYIDHARAAGLEKAMDVIIYGWDFRAYGSDRDPYTHFVERLERLERYANRKHDFVVRRVDLDNVDGELKVIRDICNRGLKDNWGYVPLTDNEMEALKHELLRIVDPDFFYIAEMNGEPAAVFLASPDYNEIIARMKGRILPLGWLNFLLYRKRVKKFTIYLFAATREAELAGIAAPVYARFFRECAKRKIEDYETGYILESNTRLCNMLDRLQAEKRKRYRLFQKPI